MRPELRKVEGIEDAVLGHAAFARHQHAPLEIVDLFGLFAVTIMVVCYALEHRSRWFVLAFAGACGLASVYGFLQGAWPFGLVEAVWALVAVRRWTTRAATRL